MSTLKSTPAAGSPSLTITEKKVAPPKEFFRNFANLPHDKVFDGYPHQKLFTLKYKGVGRDFTVNAKGSCTLKTEETAVGAGLGLKDSTTTLPGVKEVCRRSSSVSFLTAYNGTSTEASFNHKGVYKFWTNWGIYDLGQPLEFVSIFKGDTNFEKLKGSLTAFYAGSSFGSGTRVQVKEKGKSVSLAQKLTYSQDNFWGGVYADLNLNDFKFTHYNAIVGYKFNKNFQLYAEHETLKPKEMPHVGLADAITNPAATTLPTATSSHDHTKRVPPGEEPKLLDQLGVGLVKLTGAYREKNFQGAAQISWDQPNEKVLFEAGGVYMVDSNTTVRAKIDHNLDLCLAAKYRVSKHIGLNVGTYMPLQTPDQFYDARKTVPIPLGVSLEFNF